jgi:hypothetical protein
MDFHRFEGEAARAFDQVVRDVGSAFDLDSGGSGGGEFDIQPIGQGDGLEDGAELVIAIGPTVEYT